MQPPLTNTQFIQYYRQILLPEVAELGQQRILNSHVLIVGVGGLGTHVAQQLAAAGIGHLYLMDDDTVELSNLPRQILFGPQDIGYSKVSIAQQQLQQYCPNSEVLTCLTRFTPESAKHLLQQHNKLQQAAMNGQLFVLDCSDNMATRHRVNQWCVDLQLPLISAAISAFAGQLLLVDVKNSGSAGCYRCIYSEQAPSQNCQSMGVLGPAVAVMASQQALLTLKHILGIGVVDNHLHLFDGLNLSWRQIKRQRDLQCPVCQTNKAPTAQTICQEELSL